MDTIVCMKQVVDPELPLRDFAIDPATRRQVREGRPLVISTYDENALEVALQLKERSGGKVTALFLGPQASLGDAVRLALAMGADEAVVVDDPGADMLAAQKAGILTSAIRRIGRFDLVLAGCESADLVERAVGPVLAEALGAACITFVARVETSDGTALALRMADDGVHQVEVRLPAVMTVTSDESNRPRLPKVKDIISAKKKPVLIWPAAELAPSPVGLQTSGVELLDVTVPEPTTRCEFLEGEPVEQAAALVVRLRDLKVL